MTDERTDPEQDDVTLAEIEAERDVMDADIEGLAPPPDGPTTTPVEPAHEPPQLDELDQVEAELEADVMDADVEGA